MCEAVQLSRDDLYYRTSKKEKCPTWYFACPRTGCLPSCLKYLRQPFPRIDDGSDDDDDDDDGDLIFPNSAEVTTLRGSHQRSILNGWK
ncbi:hypothetical protein RUM43_005400 [Polyplax serrata]|uniref:Uncharacterized protein n=1 Tax=Polyplax serrata TaxID=468196 RepID=A0AAN8PDH4_POLSC